MKNFRYIIATVFVVAIGTVMFLSCEKESEELDNKSILKNKEQNEIVSKKHLNSINFYPFVIVTEEEKCFLDDPVSIDEFDEFDFIGQVMAHPSCFFVVHINDNSMLQKAVLCSNTPHQEWYNRLNGYFDIASNPPVGNPDEEPLMFGCITVSKLSSALTIIRLLIEEGYDYTVCYDSTTKKITICWEDEDEE